VVLVLAGIFVYYVGMQNPYISRMWLYWAQHSTRVDTVGPRSLGGFFRYIGFGPRFVYWETAFRIFQKFPLFGVGLGNYTFHFLDSMPSIQVGYMPEILTRIVPDYVRVTTAKNYFGRLLAETGILGTAAYLSFLVSLTVSGFALWISDKPEHKFWGTGALLGMVAFLIDSFSYDSLAIPNPWVVFGLITAAAKVHTSKKASK
jgi:O-antigen ligase